MTDYQALRVTLQQKLEQLRQRLGKIERDLRQPSDPDSEERAVSRENDEVLERLDDNTRKEIVQLQEAIARIDAGTYGRCTKCGDPIAPQRLQALPYTLTCIKCTA